MNTKALLMAFITIIIWGSAFAAIRAEKKVPDPRRGDALKYWGSGTFFIRLLYTGDIGSHAEQYHTGWEQSEDNPSRKRQQNKKRPFTGPNRPSSRCLS